MPDNGNTPTISRRAFVGIVGGVAAGGAATAQLDDSGGEGVLSGGYAALDRAYRVEGTNMWVGPDSARSEVAGNTGRMYIGVTGSGYTFYHGDDGSWVTKGLGDASNPVSSIHSESVRTNLSGLNDPSGVQQLVWEGLGDSNELADIDGATISNGGLIRKDPNTTYEFDSVRLLLGHDVVLGTYDPDNGGASELIKPLGGNVSIENDRQGGVLNLEVRRGGYVKMKTGDGSAEPAAKIDRFRMPSNSDLVKPEFRNVSGVQLEGQMLLRDTTADSNTQFTIRPVAGSQTVVDSEQPLLFRGGGNGSFRVFTSGIMRMDNTLNLNQQTLIQPNVYNNAGNADLTAEEVAIDENRGGTGTTAWLYKDASGTGHYWDADGTF